MMRNIKTLIFDLGNVIVPLDDDKNWWNKVFFEIFKSPEKIQDLKDNLFFVQYEKGEVTTDDFLKELEQHLLPEFDRNDIVKKWNSLLKVVPEKRWEFLKELKKRYSLFLLSNTNEIHINFIISALQESHGKDMLEDIFDYCYYSFKMNEVKPDASIYLKVLEDQNLVAEECLFIDDKMENLDSAELLGIHTQHIIPNQEINIILKDYII